MKAQIYNHSVWIGETNPEILHDVFYNLLKTSGFEVLSYTEHHFNPEGYTVLYLLGESHLALHTFPEHQQTYLELSSCVAQPFNRFVYKLLKMYYDVE